MDQIHFQLAMWKRQGISQYSVSSMPRQDTSESESLEHFLRSATNRTLVRCLSFNSVPAGAANLNSTYGRVFPLINSFLGPAVQTQMDFLSFQSPSERCFGSFFSLKLSDSSVGRIHFLDLESLAVNTRLKILRGTPSPENCCRNRLETSFAQYVSEMVSSVNLFSK